MTDKGIVDPYEDVWGITLSNQNTQIIQNICHSPITGITSNSGGYVDLAIFYP